MSRPRYILAIESSCDDTSAAVLKDRAILSNLVANQKVHEQYGGVVPELASRAHQKNIIPVVHQAIEKAGIELSQLDAIAFTRGPGLMGSLLVGTSFVKGLALATGKPLIDVNHMQAHVLAHFIDNNEYDHPPEFPFLCLTVSGGHTQIIVVRDYLDMEIIGQTLDDAAGEAFDKTAKLLGLPYPGGPQIDKLARDGNPKAYSFAKAKIKGYDYSFSGLKTSVLYFLRDQIKKDPAFIEHHVNDLCASVQHTIVDTLFDKVLKATEDLNIKTVAIAGGVSANGLLRSRLKELGEIHNWKTYIPKFEFCTDNAAMIGIVGHFKLLNEDYCDLSALPDARLAYSHV
ncbi:tRNA (adenosine(37)-N6)-threonylcarbamoyltransferase complex transferase subunit TsaD [bacterium SCSIO 12741]|nr:tRNA (adenosine(37)-N6)-threonylcarbamoyltransferase complex transferase subunit TsaD [bacterium SCSIO 12741]